MDDRETAFAELEASVELALETYSNVHRGTGYNSMASTALYERAREVVLSACGLDGERHTVIFCTPARAAAIEAAVRPGRPVVLSSRDLGLPLGLRAVIVRSEALPKGAPSQTGGGTVKMVSGRSVIWEGAPDRFEAGTPPVLNAVAFARGLELVRRLGGRAFEPGPQETPSPHEILHQDDLLGFSGRELLERLRQAKLGRGRAVPAEGGSQPYAHLDNAASTPTFRPVWNAVRQAWRLPRDRQAELVAAVRAQCADFFGAPADRYDVLFTSNATEAINVAAKALIRKPSPAPGPAVETVVLNTLAEHNSNELPWRLAEGVSMIRMAVDDEGFPDLAEMERRLREYNGDRTHGRKRIRIVAVSGASNVLGACPDLAEIGRLAHRYGALVVVDAAQLAGHRAIRMALDGLDGLVFSGHKMYAPFGAGGLVLRKGLWPAGDAAFDALRGSGDENVAGLAALGKAIDLLQRIGMDVVRDDELGLTRAALRELSSVPGLRLYGVTDQDSPRLARKLGLFSFELKGVPHNLAAEELAETAGISVRTGCFCAHLLVKRLLGMIPARQASANLGLMLAPRLVGPMLPGLIRVSFGLENGEADLLRLTKALKKIAVRPRSLAARLLAGTHNALPVLPDTETRRRMREAVDRQAAGVYGAAPAGPAALPGRAPSRGPTFWRQPCCRRISN